MRSRRRTVSSLIGILLAIAFISGTFIAIDSSARAMMEGFLRYVESDFTVIASTNDTSGLTGDLSAVPGVEAVAPFRHTTLEAGGRWGGLSLTSIPSLAIDPERPPNLLAMMQLLGNMTLSQGKAVVSGGVASLLRLEVGDGIYLQDSFRNETTSTAEPRFVNLTVEGLLIPSDPPWGPRFSVNAPPPDFVAIHIDDAEWLQRQLTGDYIPRITVEVFIDRGNILDPFDVEGSHQSLARLDRELDLVAAGYGGRAHDVVSAPFGNLGWANTLLRFLFLVISLPLVLLGLFLGAVGVDLGHAERRRELALVKTRGGSSRQLLSLLILESVLVGVLAAVIGLAAGLALSRLFLASVTAFAEGVPRYEDFILSPTTIATTIGLSVLFTFALSYRSAKRTARQPLSETLRYYAPGETRIEYRPTADLVLVSLGAAAYTFAFLGPAAGGFFLFLSGGLFFVLLPVAPALLILGLTRLLTRSTGRTYEWASRAFKSLARNMHHVISRNLARNPRRSSNVAIIIALGLAYSLFALSLFASQESWDDESLRAVVGADMSALSPAEDGTFATNVSNLAGVAGVTEIAPVPARVPGAFVEIFALDPETYFETTKPAPWYFVEGDGNAARTVLMTDGRVLLSQQYAREAFLEKDDRLQLSFSVYDEVEERVATRQLNLTVGGVVRGLPGTVFSAQSLPRALYGSFETFQEVLSQGIPQDIPELEFLPEISRKVLVDVETGADWRTLKEAILALGVGSVTVLEEERARQPGDSTRQAFLGFIRVEIAFSVVVLTVGLGLIVYASSLERKTEFASLTARGASGWQTGAILLGEGFSIMLIGVLVGVGIGLVTSYAATQTFLLGPDQTEPLVPHPFVFPLEGLLLIAVAALSMFLATLFVSWRIARIHVAKVLKLRGG